MLQRMAGNRATSLAVQPAAAVQRIPTVAPSLTIPLPEGTFVEFGKASWIKGDVGSTGEVTFVPVPAGGSAPGTTVGGTTDKGVKIDHEIAKRESVRVLDTVTFDEVTENLSFELSGKKLEIAYSMTGKVKTGFPFVSGVIEGKAVGLSLDWEKMKSGEGGRGRSVSALALEVSGGLEGEGPMQLGPIDVIAKPKVALKGSVGFNWERLMAYIGQKVAEGAVRGGAQAVTTAAGTAMVPISYSAIGVAVAGVAIPAAAAVALGYGMYQGIKNAGAASRGAALGAALRDQARRDAKQGAKGHASVLTGGPSAGDAGSEAAKQQLADIAAQHNATPEIVAVVAGKDRGYAEVYAANLRTIRQALYDEACRVYDSTFEKDFGYLESLGPSWGTRGVFRKYLRMILFSDEL